MRPGERRSRRPTLDAFLDSRSPGFDAVRLILAWCVLVSHTWPLGGFGGEPGSPLGTRTLTLGGFAVGSFFALSGLLVGRSALRRSTGAFAAARFRRIAPALWCAIVGSAFLAAPLAWRHEGNALARFVSLDPEGPIAYVVRAATLPIEFSHGIYDVFQRDTPYGRQIAGSSVNGSLWTLPYEVRCYLAIGILAIVARRWAPKAIIVGGWLASGLLVAGLQWRTAFTDFVTTPYIDHQLATFLFVFLSGAVVGLFADRIALYGWVPVAALALALIAGHRSTFWVEHIGAAAMAVVLPSAAALLAPLGRLLRGSDLSYGTYLYAWPVQQLVAMYGWASGPWAFIALSGALTTAVAAVSWFLVEEPVMRRGRSARRVPLAPASTTAAPEAS